MSVMADIKQYEVTEPWIKTDCELGEAPEWEEETNSLRFFDIVKQRIHHVNLDEGPQSHRYHELDISIGTSGDIEGNGDEFVFGGKHGIGMYNRKTGAYRYIKRFWEGDRDVEHKERNMRANDGAIDSQGRFWVTTMNDPLVKDPTDEGVVFRLDPDMTLHRMIENVTIPNGISWSADDKTMYFVDSPTKCVYAYDFDAPSGGISNRRVFFKVEDPEAVPDGHVLDEEGHMWQAVHGAGKVIRISPDGRVVAEILLPTRCVTCPGFAGEDLYITSAEEEDPDKYPTSSKLQGSIFKCHVGVKGMKPFKSRLGVSETAA